MAFPLGSPRNLTFRTGGHPTREVRAINGATRTRKFGSIPVNPTLRLDYLTSTANAELVRADYFATDSGASPATLPDAVWEGHTEVSALPAGLSWFYDSEPQVEPVRRGLVRLAVAFRGKLEA